jgi:hypothetical protein
VPPTSFPVEAVSERRHSFEKIPLLRSSADDRKSVSQRTDVVWRRAFVRGMVIAVVLHLVLLLIFRTTRMPPSPFSAAGPQAGDYRAAEGGGSGLTMIEVREQRQPPAPEVVPVPVPVPAEVPVEVPVERPAPVPDPGVVATPTQQGTGGPGTGGDAGQATGPGTAAGTGQGGGGTEDEGRSGIVAPRPRGMILPPPDRPRSARGQEVTVWVFVTERGRVVSDSTRLDPPTPDSRYNERLRRSAAEWVFEPARRAGQAVSAWYPYQIIL